ncbi:hypothetical protein E2C01_054111 [Portunus trituberculatus]|uniref:Secreted protein n=1 Tax=Portunus trituberculatus TaxID=210409 RepID=A0A5B7GRW7_PORTR|nr:hypothetical protein [Portunus trituberculatus]
MKTPPSRFHSLGRKSLLLLSIVELHVLCLSPACQREDYNYCRAVNVMTVMTGGAMEHEDPTVTTGARQHSLRPASLARGNKQCK